jgi:citrate lyase subunit beta/citryl-CoA lyase
MVKNVPAGLRSFLFAPGNHPRKVEKVFQSGADAVILDLEDAVPLAEKDSSRIAVVAAMKQPRSARGMVRINGFESKYWMADLEAVVGAWIDGIVLPKSEAPEQIRAVDVRMAQMERRAGMKEGTLELMPIIETAKGVENATPIAAASARVKRLSFGGGDYTHDLDLIWTAEEQELAYARARLTHASRVAGIEPPIDTVVIQIKDTPRFKLSAQNGRRMGFQGKLCIHPDQVAPCHEVFTPSAEEVAHARAVVAAFQAAEKAGSASIQLNGYFIDYPIVYKAQRVIALMERLQANTSR